jgi:Tol biopolymer transport system component
MSADGSSFRLLSPNKTFLGYRARLSPDGRSMLVAGRGLSFGELPTSIAAVSLVRGKVTTIYSGRLSIRTELRVLAGDWFPDGKRIAFLGNKGSRTGIYTIGVDGKGQRKVRVFPDRPPTAGGPTIYQLTVSPDGRRLAFVRAMNLYVLNANGSGLKRIARGCSLNIGDWSPDSKRLLVSWMEHPDPKRPCASPDSGLYTLPANGGTAQRVFAEKYVRTGPGESYGDTPPLGIFSPGGTRIAFMVHRLPGAGGILRHNTIMVMRANGTDLRTVRQGEAHTIQDGPYRVCTRCVTYSGLSWQRAPR